MIKVMMILVLKTVLIHEHQSEGKSMCTLVGYTNVNMFSGRFA